MGISYTFILEVKKSLWWNSFQHNKCLVISRSHWRNLPSRFFWRLPFPGFLLYWEIQYTSSKISIMDINPSIFVKGILWINILDERYDLKWAIHGRTSCNLIAWRQLWISPHVRLCSSGRRTPSIVQAWEIPRSPGWQVGNYFCRLIH